MGKPQPAPPSRGRKVLAFIGAHFFRALWLATMVLVPLFGFWLASSLAAYKNATQWLALLVGLLLFPGLPIGWELFAQWRKKKSADPKKPPKKAVLTRLDRMVLRTLLINGAFLFVTLYFAKATAFRALAVRGDWMCDGYEGALPDGFRHTILWVADRFDKRRVDSRYGDSDKAPDPWEMKRPLEQKPLTVETKKDPMAWPMDVAIDPIVRDMPEYEQSSIDSVGQYLKSRFPDTRLRAKAIHDFVVTRMHYDYDALEKINAHDYEHTPSQEAEDVFYRRAAVCEGYARLMVALGKSADVEIAYVTGYIRDSRRRLSLDSTGQPNLEGVSHAWNAVKIDGHWELVDATWDDPTNGSPTTTYLFTPPNLLTYDHLPEESAWQLRADSITLGRTRERDGATRRRERWQGHPLQSRDGEPPHASHVRPARRRMGSAAVRGA